MTGMFSYDDSLINTGAITGASLDSFMIEVFENSTSLGTWEPSDGGAFNFNFDTTTETFLVGGNSATSTGQEWGVSSTGGVNGPTVGFLSGSGGQAVSSNGGQLIFDSLILVGNSTLTATRKETATTPEPATVLGLIVFSGGLLASKRKKACRVGKREEF